MALLSEDPLLTITCQSWPAARHNALSWRASIVNVGCPKCGRSACRLLHVAAVSWPLWMHGPECNKGLIANFDCLLASWFQRRVVCCLAWHTAWPNMWQPLRYLPIFAPAVLLPAS